MTRTLQNGRYEVLETIGAGASSRVERARDTIIGRTVALKTFVQGLSQGCEQQFLHEAKIIGRLSHPSIVQLYDVGTDDNGAAYLVLEFVAGNTLEHHLTESPLPLRRACAWAADLANALAVAHGAGIIHSDVKPGNNLVTGDFKVKLGDFGVARFAAQLSGSGRVTGTPAYLSPEQIHGEKQDHRSDLFSLGVVLYEMTVGKRPFDGASLPAICAQILKANYRPPSELNPSLPPAFDQVIARCLAKSPADRFQSAEELASNLYPLARAAKSPTPVPRRSWLSSRSSLREVFVYTSLFLILAASVPGLQNLHKRLQLPSSPVLAAAPKPPGDSLAYTQHQPPDAVLDNSLPQAALPTLSHQNSSRHSLYTSVSHRIPAKTPAVNASPATPNASASALSRPVQAVQLASLNIDVTSTISEGTLAVFADQQLLLTTPLHVDGKAAPVQLQRQLSPGTHQFRVALYRADKTLQSEKEGLADVQLDASNVLAIHVGRRSKFLIRRENVLDVIWPSPSAATAEHTSTSAANSVTANK
jgi:serine/threonine protein kinase